jgi:hypothetical protein
MCAADADVLFVRADGSDSGDCTVATPCLTLPYAFSKLDGMHSVVHVLGTAFTVGSAAVDLPTRLVYLDGEDTAIRRDTSGPIFTAGNAFVSAIFSRLTFGSGLANTGAITMTQGTILIDHSTLNVPLSITGGTAEVAHSTLIGDTLALMTQCTNGGTLTVHDSVLHGSLTGMDCTFTLQRTTVDLMPKGLLVTGNGVVIIENNTITSVDYNTDALGIGGLPGSVVRFNTFANFSGVDMGAQVISCSDANVAVTSNIFAWHSHTPPGGCAVRYSLFDSIIGLQPGTGNHVGDASTFFVDMTSKDLHLSVNSPAKAVGEIGLPVTTDLEGHSRPDPIGSAPDVGAYEAP